MKLKCVHIQNYKSIAEKQKFYMNDDIAVIIGKNESGKSNILELLGNIDLLNGIQSNKVKMNRRFMNEEFYLELEFELSNEEKNKLHIIKSPITKFVITSNHNGYSRVDGFVKEYFESKTFRLLQMEVTSAVISLMSICKDASQKKQLKEYGEYLTEFEHITRPKYKNYLDLIKNIAKTVDKPSFENLLKLSEDIIIYVESLYCMFPVFHKTNNSDLSTSYIMNLDFFSKYNSQDIAIRNFIEATNIDNSVWEAASYKYPGDSVEYDAQEKIRKEVEKISNEFCNTFNYSNIFKVIPYFNRGIFSLLIKTNYDFSSPISERSQGLRWYFNLFIEMYKEDSLNRDIIFLIDEPGVHLHVTAQKELLELFQNLVKIKNQLIYSTHSPYMIDENKIYRVIPVHKSADDSTIISSSISSQDLNPISKIETLTPLLEAMGTKLKYNIGLNENEKHVITEGISDALYLNNMFRFLGVSNLKAIPSKGAPAVYLICNLVYGLGYSNFIALFDNDRAGRNGAKSVKDSFTKGLGFDYVEGFTKEHIRYVSDGILDYKGSSCEIEDLISDKDFAMLGYDKAKALDKEKLVFCYEFCNVLSSEPHKIDKRTIENFKSLVDLF